MQSVRSNRLESITGDIRQMAAQLAKDDGKIDKQDVREMLLRASSKEGGLTQKDHDDLKYVRVRYKDSFTRAAVQALDGVLNAFIQDELQRMKEEERKRKIEKHVALVEERVEFNRKDRKMRDMEVDEKQRVIVGELFGRRKRS